MAVPGIPAGMGGAGVGWGGRGLRSAPRRGLCQWGSLAERQPGAAAPGRPDHGPAQG